MVLIIGTLLFASGVCVPVSLHYCFIRNQRRTNKSVTRTSEKKAPFLETRPCGSKIWVLQSVNFLVLLLLLWYSLFRFADWHPILESEPLLGLGNDAFYFDWTKVHPASQLKFVRCYRIHQCARLEVPLDYNSSTSNGPTAAIAIIRQPSVVEVTDPRYGGAILTNPGGPGGSGVAFHLAAASELRQIVDTTTSQNYSSKDEKYFDLIGFDPRGIGFTTPQSKGLDDPVIRASWLRDNLAVGLSLKDREISDKVWARSKLYGEIVADRIPKESDSTQTRGSFTTTAIVVQDMVGIIEAYGRWRHLEAIKVFWSKYNVDKSSVLANVEYKPGEEKLNFFGISYGTLLGQMFATLQPHRIGRVFLDAVLDGQDYVDGKFMKNLNDIEAITRVFAKSCIEAGPILCPIADWGGSQGDSELFVSRVYSTISDLKEDPIALFGGDDDKISPEIISYSTVLGFIFQLWYSPAIGFKFAASLLNAVQQRNMSTFLPTIPPLSCPLPKHQSLDPSAPQVNTLCGDASSMHKMTKEQFDGWRNRLAEQSELFSDYYASIMMPCFGFDPPQPDDHEPWRFGGPFGAKTANPLLFAGQRYDPVTPIGNAEHAASKLFPGAGVLRIIDGAGHSTSAWPSVCAVEAIRTYFATGYVGKRDNVIECRVSGGPFDNGPDLSGLSESQKDSFNAANSLGKKWRDLGFGLGHRFPRDWERVHSLVEAEKRSVV